MGRAAADLREHMVSAGKSWQIIKGVYRQVFFDENVYLCWKFGCRRKSLC